MSRPVLSNKTLRFGEFEVDLPAGRLFRRGVRTRLRDQSFQVLVMLLENPGEVVSRQDLYTRLWSEDTFVDFENSLNSAIARLRKVLRDSPRHPRFIETLPKRGYRFIGAIAESASMREAGTAARRVRVVVLPFSNLSGDPANDYLSDGLTEEMIGKLAIEVPERVAVIARTTSMRFKDTDLDIRQIGLELGVDYIVEGSLRRADNRISTNFRLIRVSDQTCLWANAYEAREDNLFRTRNQAADTILERLGVSVAGRVSIGGKRKAARRGRRPIENSSAYNLYLQGRHLLNQYTPEGMQRAKACFEEAIRREPGFAIAYNALGELFWYMGFFGFVPPKEAFSRGVWAVLRAIELDDKLADAHTLLGMFRKELDYNWPEVRREMDLALDLNPWSPTTRLWNAVSGLMPLGRIEEAIVEIERGLDLDPLSPDMHFWLAEMYDLSRRYERGMKEAAALVEHAPTYWLGHFMVGQLLRDMKMYEKALVSLRRALELSEGSPLMQGWLGLTLAQRGDKREVLDILHRLRSAPSDVFVPPTSFAWIHLGLGEIDSAFDWMDRAIEVRDPMIIPIKTYPFLDPIRADRRYRTLLKKMNLDT